MPLAEAIRVLKAVEIARPLNAFELHIVTSVDSHQSNSLRGRLALPRDPRTKSEKLLIFAESGSPAAQTALNAKSAAASESEIIIGGGEIINDVLSNRISGFSKVLATPSLMPQISKELARSLGPRGLMPSAKRGTVAATAEEMQQAIQEAKGAMDWRGDRQGVVRGAVGRIHFTPEDLKRNITSFLLAIVDKVSGGAGTTSAIFSGSAAAAEARDPKKSAAMMRRASGVIKQVHLSSTQGPGILVKLPELI
ncbi:ribosomal protein L1 [Tilletiaria anomala UBC 951]|uniref:Ribosomal protein n=1 Tax=Tilletiaria anomala (strain ATCC 24038 / CBS 436.72 / UBC 951) TaxID=1037660 RepID=A0A066W005_TILAU|nr:ribosomal protein L1 [Tilletiaria anomala UBC 951]KDN44374.1 ribosomal protein L1 [Tilletiaria anomala UBC 951]